jgi:hypothetical protein
MPCSASHCCICNTLRCTNSRILLHRCARFSACLRIRQQTSASVSIRQHPSAYASIRNAEDARLASSARQRSHQHHPQTSQPTPHALLPRSSLGVSICTFVPVKQANRGPGAWSWSSSRPEITCATLESDVFSSPDLRFLVL